MNGTKPKFLETTILPQSYYATPDPYKNPVQTKVNLRGLSKYAKEQGKKITELSKEELEKFRV